MDSVLKFLEDLVPQKSKFGQFVLSQIINGSKSSARARVWSTEMITFAMNIWARYYLQLCIKF